MIQNKNMTVQEFVPMQNFIVVDRVELDKGPEIAEGSEILISMEQNNSIVDRPTTGTVLRAGKEAENVKVGDEVIWVEADGMEMMFKDGEYLILRENSILGYKES